MFRADGNDVSTSAGCPVAPGREYSPEREPIRSGGFSRRGFFQAGMFGGAVASLAGILRADEAAGKRGSAKSVIFVHLDGGPPQLDTIDLKPQAPVEIRGEFHPIATSVPGISVCELFPKLAQMADRIAFIRSLVGSAGEIGRAHV